MKCKKWTEKNQAVAGVIEALLLVALVAIVISIIQLQYIPQIMEQREAEHMDEVSNQFSHLKSLIDIQALTGTMGVDVPLSFVPMMEQITLGSREMPYFISAPAYGEMSVNNSGQSYITTEPDYLYYKGQQKNNFSLSMIKYSADNSYFIDQTYILEGGGIILSQSDESSVMRADPCISIKDAGNKIMVRWYLPNIIGVQGKNDTYGNGKCFVRTIYSDYQNFSGPLHNIIIKSDHLNAWNESLNRLFRDVMYDDGDEPSPENKTVDISITWYEGNNVVKILSLHPESKPLYLSLMIVDIYCQIGPGWVM